MITEAIPTDMVGHENRLTTEIYLHSIGEGEHVAVDCLDRGCEGALNVRKLWIGD